MNRKALPQTSQRETSSTGVDRSPEARRGAGLRTGRTAEVSRLTGVGNEPASGWVGNGMGEQQKDERPESETELAVESIAPVPELLAFAAEHHVEVPAGASRDDLAEAIRAAGLEWPTARCSSIGWITPCELSVRRTTRSWCCSSTSTTSSPSTTRSGTASATRCCAPSPNGSVVSPAGDTPARLGGDEFALLLEDEGGVDRAVDVAETLLTALREPVPLAGYDLTVLASVGVAVASPGMTTAGLLRDADVAMYEAKRAGKSQIKIFDPAMRLSATRHLEFRSDLANAIERNSSGWSSNRSSTSPRRGGGAEALLRWHHPTRGAVSPSEFIPIAERAGLILPIGRWVLEQSIESATKWQGGPTTGERQRVGGADPVTGLRGSRAPVAGASGLDPCRLTLEITETMLVEEVESASGNLAELRKIGVSHSDR